MRWHRSDQGTKERRKERADDDNGIVPRHISLQNKIIHYRRTKKGLRIGLQDQQWQRLVSNAWFTVDSRLPREKLMRSEQENPIELTVLEAPRRIPCEDNIPNGHTESGQPRHSSSTLLRVKNRDGMSLFQTSSRWLDDWLIPCLGIHQH